MNEFTSDQVLNHDVMKIIVGDVEPSESEAKFTISSDGVGYGKSSHNVSVEPRSIIDPSQGAKVAYTWDLGRDLVKPGDDRCSGDGCTIL